MCFMQALAHKILSEGHEVPRFLLDISDKEHVPPHIVACELMAQNRQLFEEVQLLSRKLEEEEENAADVEKADREKDEKTENVSM